MADNYCTIQQARDYLYQSQETDEDLISVIIPRASRLIDAYIGVSDGYFSKGSSSQTASARTFWGDGTDYLSVDPYLSATTPTLTMPTGFSVLGWIEANPYQRNRMSIGSGEFFLVRTYGDDGNRYAALNERRDYFYAEFSNQIDYLGWPAGIKVTVTAKWGWDAIPADITEACLETVASIWRSKDQAFARAVAIDGAVVINDPMPPRARMVLDGYKLGRGTFA